MTKREKEIKDAIAFMKKRQLMREVGKIKFYNKLKKELKCQKSPRLIN